MDSTYANQYRDLYARHWWWRSREREILRQITRHLGQPDGTKSILDVGCGDGLFFDKLSSWGKVTGVEGDRETLSPNGKWKDHIHVRMFDSSFLPNESYDAILMLDILEHMPNPQLALEHARELLAPGGILVATVPAFMSLWTSHDDLNHHVIRYRSENFCPLITRSGFHIRNSNYLFHWTCPVKLMISLKERFFGGQPEAPQVPAGWINTACNWLSQLEQATISRLPMPFGSSLMVVGSTEK